MEKPGGQIWVRTFEQKVCVRVQGRATHLHAAPFQAFASEMVGKGHDAFEIDLGPCSSMDSTFLGVLVGLSMKLEKSGRPKPVIFRAAPCTCELFKTLGVERFFEINGPGLLMNGAALELGQLEGAPCGTTEWATTIINAHQLLVEVDDRNGPRFQDLLDYMKRDLAGRPNPTRWQH